MAGSHGLGGNGGDIMSAAHSHMLAWGMVCMVTGWAAGPCSLLLGATPCSWQQTCCHVLLLWVAACCCCRAAPSLRPRAPAAAAQSGTGQGMPFVMSWGGLHVSLPC
jgi:hypothetical protein